MSGEQYGIIGLIVTAGTALWTAILTGKLVPGRFYDELLARYQRLEEKYDRAESISEGVTEVAKELVAIREERQRERWERGRNEG